MPLVVLVPLLVAGAVLVAFVAARRSVAQPLSLADEDERRLLGYVLNHPEAITLCGVLSPEHFAAEPHRRLWQELRDAVGFELPDEDEQLARALMQKVPDDLADRASDQALVGALRAHAATDEDSALASGAQVLEAGDDRLIYGSQGAGRVRAGGEGEPTLVRVYQRPGLVRLLVAAMVGAIGAVGIWRVDAGGYSTAALGVLLVGSVLWALVDLDTLYIDYPSMALFGVGAWILGIVGAVSDGNAGHIVVGAASALGVAAMFEFSNWAFKKVRGVDGMGGGDAVLVLATIGVPALVTGSVWVAYSAMLSSLIAAIAGWVLLRVARGATSNTPFALGPYLALGWVAALFTAAGLL